MRPGIKTTITGGILLIGGAVVVPLICVLFVVLQQHPDAEFQSPGSMEVTIKEAGRYYLWNDYQTIYQGKSYDRSETIPDGLEIQIRDASGHPLKFINDGSTTEKNNGVTARKTIGYVDIEQPGKVVVQVSGGPESRIFSFARSDFFKMFGLFLGVFALAAVTALAGLGLIVWGVIKLVRNKPATP